MALQRAGQPQDKVPATQFRLTVPECLSGQALDVISVYRPLGQPLWDDQRKPRIPQCVGVAVKHEALRARDAA
jgi:hypothetical protein